MKARIAGLGALALVGCGPMNLEDGSGLQGALLLDGDVEAVVSYSHRRFRYEDGDFWGKGRRVYYVDEKVLALVDPTTGAVKRELLRDESDVATTGDGNYLLSDTFGRWVLVDRERRRDLAGVELAPYERFLLNVDTGKTEPVEPERELATLGLVPARTSPLFVHKAGILILRAHASETGDPRAGALTEHVLRYPGGRVVSLGRCRNPRVHEGRLIVWFEGDRLRTSIDPVTLARATISNQDYSQIPSMRKPARAQLPKTPNHATFRSWTPGMPEEWTVEVDVAALR